MLRRNHDYSPLPPPYIDKKNLPDPFIFIKVKEDIFRRNHEEKSESR